MPDSITVQKIKETAALLNSHGIATLDDLRMCISQDVERGVHWVSISTGTSQALLMALLIAETTDDAAKKGTRRLFRYWRSLKTFPAILWLSIIEIKGVWGQKKLLVVWHGVRPVWAVALQSFVRPKRLWHNRKRHWPDALAAALVLLLSTGVLLRAVSISKGGHQYVAARQEIRLPIFHELSDNDLETKSAPGSNGSFTNFDQVRGRYTLTAIPAGAVLLANQLLSADLSARMKGRRMLSVALKPTAYSATFVAPSEAVMILSPRTLDAKIVEPIPFDVIVLSIDTIGESKSATVALSEDKLVIAAPLLASHEVFLSQVIP